jgi:hypothetical protein
MLLLALAAGTAYGRVGDGWGTNIHFVAEGAVGEMAMLSKAFKVARMDFHWAVVEKQCGSYNFSAYDGLLSTMKAHGVRPYWILDYGNPCYPPAPPPDCSTKAKCSANCPTKPLPTCSDGVYYCCGVCSGVHICPTNAYLKTCACNNNNPLEIVGVNNITNGDPRLEKSAPCNTAECIAAFGRFAAAAVEHFKGHDIIFECLNEPNGMGGDNATDITALCLSAGTHFSAAKELFVGPATSTFDPDYMATAMDAGILGAFGALSVHPYRPLAPDTVLDDWSKLRGMMQTHGQTAAQRSMPMISGEWGYTSALPPCSYGNRVSEHTQAAYLARMWLSNMLGNVSISINYDWRDGSNPTDCESGFGSVHCNATGNQSMPFLPKLKYRAALALQSSVGEFDRVGQRIKPSHVAPVNLPHTNVFVQPFFTDSSGTGARGSESTAAVAFAVWTNGTSAKGECTPSTPIDQRADCGHLHINESACLSPANPKGPGCCWNPEDKGGGPECFKKRDRIVAVEANVSFTAEGYALSCWLVHDLFGQVLPQPRGRVCAGPAGGLDVTVPVMRGATASSPIYLLPTPVAVDHAGVPSP